MNFKYYDTLSQLVMGFIVLVVLMNVIGLQYDNSYSVPYLAFAFVIGYFINIISSLLEKFFYWTIGGMPSDRLLKIKQGKNYSGTNKIKFYQTQKVIQLLKEDVGDKDASERKMFAKAMRIANNNEKSRAYDFNAHYAFSRVVLTTFLLITIILIIKYPCCWKTYLIIIPLLLAWERYRERGYYYAKEVLNEYIEYKEKQL
jgi:hypothetical protein